MNLRADLILATEQRSASLINPKSIGRIATIIVPLIVVLLIASVVMNTMNLGRRVRDAETQWLATEPKKEKAQKLSLQAKQNRTMLGEIEGWHEARVEWNAQLAAIQEDVSPQIQMNNLRISQVLKLVDDKIPSRIFTLDIAGKAVSAGAEHAVEAFQRRLLTAPVFSGRVQTVEISRFGADPANKNDRVFQLGCTYAPRQFECNFQTTSNSASR
jgi:hypothetical protein